MTRFEKFKNIDIDALTEWLDEHINPDESPWSQWFNENYCQKCESIRTFVHYLNGEHECAWCEVNDKCKYFQELDKTLSCKDIVRMWLEGEE